MWSLNLSCSLVINARDIGRHYVVFDDRSDDERVDNTCQHASSHGDTYQNPSVTRRQVQMVYLPTYTHELHHSLQPTSFSQR